MKMKRGLALLLSAVLALSCTTAAAAEQKDSAVTEDTLIGDANLNGRVTVQDVTVLQLLLANEQLPSDENMRRVLDVDGNGRINIEDATEMQRYLSEYPVTNTIGKRFGEVFPGVLPTEAPATEEPTTEQPATEQPATEEPATEQPATEQPATEEPATEEPATEQPATEEPATEEPATEEPATEQPATEEPATEQPATEEPATEEPATEQPATEEPATEQPATEEPATEQPFALSLNIHSVIIGDAEYVPLRVTCSTEEPPALTFVSDNPEVAEVDQTGMVRAHKAGTATVTCSGGGASDSCVVSVWKTAQSLKLNRTELTLGVGEAFDLNSTIPNGYAAYHRPYTSDNASVAEVTLSGGYITAKKAGTANITCTLLNGVKAVCRVTVLPMPQTMTLNAVTLQMPKGDTFDFNSIIPSGTAAYYRKFYSENPSVVSIQQSGGLATAVKEGTARIYCQLNNGVRAYATVTVTSDLRSIMVSHLRAQIGKNNSSFVAYINSHSSLGVSSTFPWCAVFAWSALDQFATKVGKKNPIAPRKHVSEIVLQARALGAHHYVADNNYMPKPGDLFTTSALTRPDDDGRDHIGYVESVETDANGKIKKVHTIEGNFAWEVNGAPDTYVWRGEWVPGVRNEYGSAICEFLDLERIFK